MINIRNEKLLNKNTKELQIKVSNFVNIDNYLNKIFNGEFKKEHLKNIENYLIHNDFTFKSTQKILFYYLQKNKIEDKELFLNIYKKFNLKNKHSKFVFEIYKEENNELENLKYLNSYQKMMHQKNSFEKLNEQLNLYCTEHQLDNYTTLDLKILLTQQLLKNTNNKLQKELLNQNIKDNKEKQLTINWNEVDKNNFTIPTFEINKNISNVFDLKNEFNQKLFKESNIDKTIWKYVFKTKLNEENLLDLRTYLINKNLNLNSIEYIEKTFIEQNTNKENEKIINKIKNDHKVFWKKDLNEFIANDKILKDSFLTKDKLKLEIYLKNNNFEKQLCNFIINDFNNVTNQTKSLAKIEEKNTSNFDKVIKLNEALNLSFDSQQKIINCKEKINLEFENIINEFGKQTTKNENQNLEKHQINLKQKHKNKITKTPIVYPNFNSKKVLNDMKNREEELIYNLSSQMWIHEQN